MGWARGSSAANPNPTCISALHLAPDVPWTSTSTLQDTVTAQARYGVSPLVAAATSSYVALKRRHQGGRPIPPNHDIRAGATLEADWSNDHRNSPKEAGTMAPGRLRLPTTRIRWEGRGAPDPQPPSPCRIQRHPPVLPPRVPCTMYPPSRVGPPRPTWMVPCCAGRPARRQENFPPFQPPHGLREWDDHNPAIPIEAGGCLFPPSPLSPTFPAPSTSAHPRPRPELSAADPGQFSSSKSKRGHPSTARRRTSQAGNKETTAVQGLNRNRLP